MNMVRVGEQRSVTPTLFPYTLSTSRTVSQVPELNLIRQALYDLESAHNKIRQQYDEEIARLRADVAQQAQVAAVQQQQPQQQQHVQPSQSQASLPPPPPTATATLFFSTRVPHHQVQVSQTRRMLCHAQIYDTKPGAKTCVLTDETAGKAGDLYIQSVCFSPDGKLLATGAEDKQIWIWDISKKRIVRVFDGHQQEIYSLDFSLDGRLIVSGSGDKTARIWDVANADAQKC
ncbi:WD40-repeat-containing domain protein [Amanita muscaria]